LEHAWRWCRRNPAGAAVVAAVLALVGLSVGVGLSAQRQQVEASRRAGRAREAVGVMMKQAAGLIRQGLWEEARAVLAQAEGRLDDAGAGDLSRRLAQARSEVDLSESLEAKRMALMERFWFGRDSRTAGQDY